MITHLSHATLYVDDHERALEFYVGKLGFEKRSDQTLEGFRWLTIAPPEQKNLEIVLMELKQNPMLSAENVEKLRDLMRAGALGAGVLTVDDCKKTYEDLRGKGVEFMGPPQERPYGIEAMMKDPFGNWFSMTEPRS